VISCDHFGLQTMKAFATLLFVTAIFSIAVAVDDETSLNDSWLEDTKVTEPPIPDDSMLSYPPEWRDYATQRFGDSIHRPTHEAFSEFVVQQREKGILVMTEIEADTYITEMGAKLERAKEVVWALGTTIIEIGFNALLMEIFGINGKSMNTAYTLVSFFTGCVGSIVEKNILSFTNATSIKEHSEVWKLKNTGKECVKNGIQYYIGDLLNLWCNILILPIINLFPKLIPAPHNIVLYLASKHHAVQKFFVSLLCPVITVMACTMISIWDKVFTIKINQWAATLNNAELNKDSKGNPFKARNRVWKSNLTARQVMDEEILKAKNALKKWQTLGQLFHTFETYICGANTIGMEDKAGGNAGGNAMFVEPKEAPSGIKMETAAEAAKNPILVADPKVAIKAVQSEKELKNSGLCLKSGTSVTSEMAAELAKVDAGQVDKTTFLVCPETAARELVKDETDATAEKDIDPDADPNAKSTAGDSTTTKLIDELDDEFEELHAQVDMTR